MLILLKVLCAVSLPENNQKTSEEILNERAQVKLVDQHSQLNQ